MPDWNSDWTGGFKPIARSTKKQHLVLCRADSWWYWQVQRDLLGARHRGRGAGSLKVTLNTIYSRDLAYLSWKLHGVEGWDADRLQIKRSPCLRFFTKIRFSVRRIASCSLRPSGPYSQGDSLKHEAYRPWYFLALCVNAKQILSQNWLF